MIFYVVGQFLCAAQTKNVIVDTEIICEVSVRYRSDKIARGVCL
jgi:hypothetical protein